MSRYVLAVRWCADFRATAFEDDFQFRQLSCCKRHERAQLFVVALPVSCDDSDRTQQVDRSLVARIKSEYVPFRR